MTAGGHQHSVAVVIPVYRGEHVLPSLVEEIDCLTRPQSTPEGNEFQVTEVVLVHDSGPDRSDLTIRSLAQLYPYVQPVWLARNFGPHAATLAGMSATHADWIVTMDEDGQHDPGAIGAMLDLALRTRSALVYAEPTNNPFHSRFRNFTSRIAHGLAVFMSGGDLRHFHSFRFLLGEVGRGLAAHCGESVYLDVALTWVVDRRANLPIAMRKEQDRPSGFSTRRLLSHFWRMVLTSGTRPLRIITFCGALLALVAVGVTGWIVWAKITNQVPVEGWASMMVVLLLTSGAALFALGILAEYVGVVARSAMGKPLFLVIEDPADGPMGSLEQPFPALTRPSSEPSESTAALAGPSS